MKTKLVNVRLPEKLYEEGKKIVENNGYANFQEFIKDSIRHSIAEAKEEQWMKTLKRLYGSTKGKEKKRLTKKEKEKIAEEHTPERAREITKRMGLEDIRV